MSKFPERNHFDCDRDRCKTCLDDHWALARYIQDESGLQPQFHDFLGEYRTWLDREDIPSEGEDGWATRQAWDKKNVDAFVVELAT